MSVLDILKKENSSIGVFGLGKSNLGILDYLKRKNFNFKLTVRSDKPIDTIPTEAARVLAGNNALLDINEDVLFLSPSVRRDREEITKAIKRGTVISSDAELFFESTETEHICITGSDGKSTTTRLISDVLSASGISAVPAGNYGQSLCSLIDTKNVPVVELSSFQLNYFTPSVFRAVITNITPNHLNWHLSLEEYVKAKMNVTKKAKAIIYDSDCDLIDNELKETYAFSKTSLSESYESLKAQGGAENYVTFKNGIIYANGSPFIDITNAKKKEPYTVRNFLLATAATLDICKADRIEKALLSFSGLPHRAELVLSSGGVEYINSSIDSSPERTLKTLSAISGSIIVIIGGMGKGLSLDGLADALPYLTRGAVLLGEVGDALANILSSKSKGYNFLVATDMRDAVIKAREMVEEPSSVVLSPAATSFDRYKNFEERGNDFKRIVLSLHA